MPDGLSRMNIFLAVTVAIGSLLIGPMGPVIASGEIDGDSTAMNQTTSLAPVLDGLADASDPDSHAQANNIDYNEGIVTVVVELEAETDLPDGHGTTVEHTYSGAGQNLVQASVPVDQLRDLAAEDTVDYVRPPQEATPMEGGDEQSMPVMDDLTDGNDSIDGADNAGDTRADDSEETATDTDSTDDELGTWLPAVVAIAVLLVWAGFRTARGGARSR